MIFTQVQLMWIKKSEIVIITKIVTEQGKMRQKDIWFHFHSGTGPPMGLTRKKDQRSSSIELSMGRSRNAGFSFEQASFPFALQSASSPPSLDLSCLFCLSPH